MKISAFIIHPVRSKDGVGALHEIWRELIRSQQGRREKVVPGATTDKNVPGFPRKCYRISFLAARGLKGYFFPRFPPMVMDKRRAIRVGFFGRPRRSDFRTWGVKVGFVRELTSLPSSSDDRRCFLFALIKNRFFRTSLRYKRLASSDLQARISCFRKWWCRFALNTTTDIDCHLSLCRCSAPTASQL